MGSQRHHADSPGGRGAAQRLLPEDDRRNDPRRRRLALHRRLTGRMATAPSSRSLVELRLLDGPNLYFPRPAAKLTLDLSKLVALPDTAARDLGTEAGLGGARPGAAATVFRQRFVIRLLTQIVRRIARAGGATR